MSGAQVIRERHKKLLESCLENLGEFVNIVQPPHESSIMIDGGWFDAASAGRCLREAAKNVASLTGRGFTTEDVLGRIFADFCVGK